MNQNSTRFPLVNPPMIIGGLLGLSVFISWWLSQRLVPPTILVLLLNNPIWPMINLYITEVLAFLIGLILWAQLFKAMKIKQPWQLSTVLVSLSIGIVTLVMSALHQSLEWQNVWRAVLYILAGAIMTPWVLEWMEKLKNGKRAGLIAVGSIVVTVILLIVAGYIHTYHRLLLGY